MVAEATRLEPDPEEPVDLARLLEELAAESRERRRSLDLGLADRLHPPRSGNSIINEASQGEAGLGGQLPSLGQMV